MIDKVAVNCAEPLGFWPRLPLCVRDKAAGLAARGGAVFSLAEAAECRESWAR